MLKECKRKLSESSLTAKDDELRVLKKLKGADKEFELAAKHYVVQKTHLPLSWIQAHCTAPTGYEGIPLSWTRSIAQQSTELQPQHDTAALLYLAPAIEQQRQPSTTATAITSNTTTQQQHTAGGPVVGIDDTACSKLVCNAGMESKVFCNGNAKVLQKDDPDSSLLSEGTPLCDKPTLSSWGKSVSHSYRDTDTLLSSTEDIMSPIMTMPRDYVQAIQVRVVPATHSGSASVAPDSHANQAPELTTNSSEKLRRMTVWNWTTKRKVGCPCSNYN